MKRDKAAAAIATFAIVAAAFACTSQSDPSDKPPLYGGIPAPGGGVCCSLGSPCSPGFHGGWAATAQDCGWVMTYGEGSFEKVTDEHGCEKWIAGGDGGGRRVVCDGLKDASVATDAADAADAGDSD